MNNRGSTCVHNATYQVSRSSASWFLRDFSRFLPYIGVAAMLVQNLFNYFLLPRPLQLAWWFERSRLKLWTDDGACPYYKFPRSPWLRLAKILIIIINNYNNIKNKTNNLAQTVMALNLSKMIPEFKLSAVIFLCRNFSLLLTVKAGAF